MDEIQSLSLIIIISIVAVLVNNLSNRIIFINLYCGAITIEGGSMCFDFAKYTKLPWMLSYMDLDARKPVFRVLRTTEGADQLAYWKVSYLDLLQAFLSIF